VKQIFETAITPKNVLYILSQLHLSKLVFGSVLTKKNEQTRTVTLHYISLSTENSKIEHVRSVYHKRASELFLVGGNELTLFKKE